MRVHGKLDHGMILRLLFVMILLGTVTGLIKSYALKKNAANTTPRLAYRYFLQWHQLSLKQKTLPFILPAKNTGFPVDGWGKSFYLLTRTGILVSAGGDERFHSSDDLHYFWIPQNCPDPIRQWIKDSKKRKHFRLESLPKGVSFSPQQQLLVNEEGACKLPDLSGDDGFYNSRDDLFESIFFLEEGQLPVIKANQTRSKE